MRKLIKKFLYSGQLLPNDVYPKGFGLYTEEAKREWLQNHPNASSDLENINKLKENIIKSRSNIPQKYRYTDPNTGMTTDRIYSGTLQALNLWNPEQTAMLFKLPFKTLGNFGKAAFGGLGAYELTNNSGPNSNSWFGKAGDWGQATIDLIGGEPKDNGWKVTDSNGKIIDKSGERRKLDLGKVGWGINTLFTQILPIGSVSKAGLVPFIEGVELAEINIPHKLGNLLWKTSSTDPKIQANVENLNRRIKWARENVKASGMTEDELAIINRYLSGDKSPNTISAYKNAVAKLKAMNMDTPVKELLVSDDLGQRLLKDDEFFRQYFSRLKLNRDNYPNHGGGDIGLWDFIKEAKDIFNGMNVGDHFIPGGKNSNILSGESLKVYLPRLLRALKKGQLRMYLPENDMVWTNEKAALYDPAVNLADLRRNFGAIYEAAGIPFNPESIIYNAETNKYLVPNFGFVKTSKIPMERYGNKLFKRRRW